MKKSKIAISLDKSLLDQIDSKVDGSIIRSRSQAVEYFLKKGLKESSIDVAVLLIKGEHQPNLLKEFKGKSLLKQQIDFFYAFWFYSDDRAGFPTFVEATNGAFCWDVFIHTNTVRFQINNSNNTFI